jgi:hypothetical protein
MDVRLAGFNAAERVEAKPSDLRQLGITGVHRCKAMSMSDEDDWEFAGPLFRVLWVEGGALRPLWLYHQTPDDRARRSVLSVASTVRRPSW